MITAKTKAPKHNWKSTQRRDKGVVLKFHACTQCPKAHMRAYDMEVVDRALFQGEWEFKQRSQRT
jgi:hypothetical protein